MKAHTLSRPRSVLSLYFELCKPGVMLLVVFTDIAGVLVSPKSLEVHYFVLQVLAVALCSSGAGAINMWYDQDIDSVMQRTSKRPIPMGLVRGSSALLFGLSLCCIGFGMMCLVSLSGFFWLLFATLFYAVIYTMLLKRHTVQNIVIGGIAGSLPPLIGYVSTGAALDNFALTMFAMIFFWTPAHFWALALNRHSDYVAVNIPMMPIKGSWYTKCHILFYTVLTVASSVVPIIDGRTGMVYALFAAWFNLRFMWYSIQLFYNEKLSIKMFIFSIYYLFAIFGALILDQFIVVK